MRKVIILIILFMFIITVVADAKKSCELCIRDKHGRIYRNSTERCKFMKSTGYDCKIGRPNWVIDHIIPLCLNGEDIISNMQWQTKEEALEKDKWEREICKAQKRP